MATTTQEGAEMMKLKTKKKKDPQKRLYNKRQIIFMGGHCQDPVNLERKQKRSKVENFCSVHVLDRAKAVQSSLPPRFPSLFRPMLPSHVTGCFWLGLPKKFCIRHLPKEDTSITLEDENGEQYETRYLWQKYGLSGGWRGFSIAHELLEGDVVVFQLVKPTKFKVYIVRSNQSEEVDGALVLPLPQLDIFSNNSASDAENNSETCDMLIDKDNTYVPKPDVDFKDLRSIENFVIVVDGLVIDSEIPKHLKIKYYELCCSQKRYLHAHLVKGLNCKLAAGIVSETVNIADAIRVRASKNMGTFSCEKIPIWEKTLSAFKDLGMEVGFLVARLEKLMKLDNESRRLKDARRERGHVEQEKIELEARVRVVAKALSRLDAEIMKMEAKEKRHESMFSEMANAPW